MVTGLWELKKSIANTRAESLLSWEVKMKVKSLSHIRLFATPWTVAHQVPLSMGFFRQEYWSGLPFPSPGLTHLLSKVNLRFPFCCKMICLQLNNFIRIYRKSRRNFQRLAKKCMWKSLKPARGWQSGCSKWSGRWTACWHSWRPTRRRASWALLLRVCLQGECDALDSSPGPLTRHRFQPGYLPATPSLWSGSCRFSMILSLKQSWVRSSQHTACVHTHSHGHTHTCTGTGAHA